MKTKSEFDFITLLVSIAAGIIGFFVSSLVGGLVASLWKPLVIGIELMVFLIVLVVIMVIYSMINDNLGSHIHYHHDSGKLALSIVSIIALTFLLGMVFDAIYGANFFSKDNQYKEPTSYIFIIDNSGSMSISDPDGLRYNAINDIMESRADDFPLAIYSFSDNVVVERSMGAKRTGNYNLIPQNEGETAMKKALETIYDDYDNDRLQGIGDNPKVLLLSDGYATDINKISEMDDILKQYKKSGFTISTVGLGEADDDLMDHIADSTGGVYISVDQAKDLEQAMQTGINEVSEDRYSRTLLTYRYSLPMDWLYCLMRIVFMAILGFMMSFTMLFCTGKGDDDHMIFYSSIITGLIAGIVEEIGVNMLMFSPTIMYLIYCMLVASTFITTTSYYGSPNNNQQPPQQQAPSHNNDYDDFDEFNELL